MSGSDSYTTPRPCPFCGGESVVDEENNGLPNGMTETLFRVRCTMRECGHQGMQWYPKQSAVNAWNKRHEPESKPEGGKRITFDGWWNEHTGYGLEQYYAAKEAWQTALKEGARRQREDGGLFIALLDATSTPEGKLK